MQLLNFIYFLYLAFSQSNHYKQPLLWIGAFRRKIEIIQLITKARLF